jgi:predicted RNase H-like HicB family nuclease
VLDRFFKRTPAEHSHPPVTATINILCRFWLEDGVWNGSAVDLPVSVFGETIEQSQQHLIDAVVCHLEALQEVGRLEQEMQRLQHLAQDCRLSVDQMGEHELLWRTTATVSDHRVAAACP